MAAESLSECIIQHSTHRIITHRNAPQRTASHRIRNWQAFTIWCDTQFYCIPNCQRRQRMHTYSPEKLIVAFGIMTMCSGLFFLFCLSVVLTFALAYLFVVNLGEQGNKAGTAEYSIIQWAACIFGILTHSGIRIPRYHRKTQQATHSSQATEHLSESNLSASHLHQEPWEFALGASDALGARNANGQLRTPRCHFGVSGRPKATRAPFSDALRRFFPPSGRHGRPGCHGRPLQKYGTWALAGDLGTQDFCS